MNNPQKTKVLLVEDNHIAQKVARLNFEECACDVDLAETGKQALSSVQKNHYELILMDVGLADTNGYEVTKKVRELEKTSNRRSTIIGLSAHIDDEHKKRCIKAGMDAVYVKPLTPSITRSILKTFIE